MRWKTMQTMTTHLLHEPVTEVTWLEPVEHKLPKTTISLKSLKPVFPQVSFTPREWPN